MNDVVNEFLDKADNFDGFVFGSPVHFAAAAGVYDLFLWTEPFFVRWLRI